MAQVCSLQLQGRVVSDVPSALPQACICGRRRDLLLIKYLVHHPDCTHCGFVSHVFLELY